MRKLDQFAGDMFRLLNVLECSFENVRRIFEMFVYISLPFLRSDYGRRNRNFQKNIQVQQLMESWKFEHDEAAKKIDELRKIVQNYSQK